MELQPLKIRFYPKRKWGNNDRYTLYMRITLSGNRADICLHYDLLRDIWDENKQCLRAKNPDEVYILNLINQYRHRALDIYQQLILHGISCDVNTIRQKLTGDSNSNNSNTPTLFKLFNRITERKKALLGKNNSKATIQKYKCCKSHLELFIKKFYKTDDIVFNKINLEFIEDFELHLKTEGECCNNTTMKHIQTFKSIYKSALAYGWVVKDPFQKYKIRMEEVVRDFLSEKEIQSLIDLDLPPNKLANVRDLFIFSCYTGLAYIDLKNLSIKNISEENGKYWIRTRRQKTNVKSNIPILDLPFSLIKKYCPELENEDANKKIFHVISNQKMNNYLKQLADLCGINKCLTFHIARHTFATTITLNNGVPIESVSSMLGHKHITTTQHYAKLLDKRLEEDMDKLSQKLNNKDLSSLGEIKTNNLAL